MNFAKRVLDADCYFLSQSMLRMLHCDISETDLDPDGARPTRKNKIIAAAACGLATPPSVMTLSRNMWTRGALEREMSTCLAGSCREQLHLRGSFLRKLKSKYHRMVRDSGRAPALVTIANGILYYTYQLPPLPSLQMSAPFLFERDDLSGTLHEVS